MLRCGFDKNPLVGWCVMVVRNDSGRDPEEDTTDADREWNDYASGTVPDGRPFILSHPTCFETLMRETMKAEKAQWFEVIVCPTEVLPFNVEGDDDVSEG